MRVKQNRNQHDRVAEQDRDQRLPPVHARADQSRRKHVSRNAVRHADPERSIVVRRPVPIRDFDRREIAIEQRALADLCERCGLKLDAAVGILNCFGVCGQCFFQKSYSSLKRTVTCEVMESEPGAIALSLSDNSPVVVEAFCICSVPLSRESGVYSVIEYAAPTD